MKNKEIVDAVNNALRCTFESDSYLLKQDLNERTVSHQIAFYLKLHCPVSVDVDCEYNKNVIGDKGQKYIGTLKAELHKLGLLKENEKDLDEEIIERDVYPDIIVHKRGTTDNYCIVEVKKSTSKIKNDYDLIKLKCFTSTAEDNDYNYKVGIFLFLKISLINPSYTISWFLNGQEVTEADVLAADRT